MQGSIVQEGHHLGWPRPQDGGKGGKDAILGGDRHAPVLSSDKSEAERRDLSLEGVSRLTSLARSPAPSDSKGPARGYCLACRDCVPTLP